MEFLYPQEKLSVPEIASRYQVSQQHVQVTVNALRKKGLLESGPNPRHKRSVLMELSEKGGELFAEILAQDKETVERLFSEVSPKDQETTRRTLEILLKELSREEPQKQSARLANLSEHKHHRCKPERAECADLLPLRVSL